MLRRGDLHVLTISKRLGIYESAVRGHLERMERDRLVRGYFKRAPVGRPKKYYGLRRP